MGWLMVEAVAIGGWARLGWHWVSKQGAGGCAIMQPSGFRTGVIAQQLPPGQPNPSQPPTLYRLLHRRLKLHVRLLLRVVACRRPRSRRVLCLRHARGTLRGGGRRAAGRAGALAPAAGLPHAGCRHLLRGLDLSCQLLPGCIIVLCHVRVTTLQVQAAAGREGVGVVARSESGCR